MSRKGNTFSFRLRKIDADLLQAVELVDSNELSDLCRDGLRMVLGLTTTKRIEATERPLYLESAGTLIPIRSKPAAWINPNKQRGGL